MRHLASSIVLSHLLAESQHEADRQAADEWRRLHARPDAPPLPPGESGRAAVFRQLRGLAVRLLRIAPRRTGAA